MLLTIGMWLCAVGMMAQDKKRQEVDMGSRRKFSEWIQKENSPVLIARYGKRKLINREAFEEYLDKHPELRRRE